MKKCANLGNSKCSQAVPVFFVILVFVLFNLNTFTAWFRSDSQIYYQGICQSVNNLKSGEFSLANLGIAGHTCYGYSLFVFIGQLLIPYQGVGVRLANLCMALITIWLFWKLLSKIFPILEEWTRVFITAAFAFSPFMLGIFSEIHTDFPVLCFFVWLVYFYVTGQEVMCLLTGFLLCFSKEIGVLYYCAFFGSCFLYRLVKNENTNWLKKLGDEFSICEWLLLVPADLFLICATTSRSWAGSAINPKLTDGTVNTFHLSWDYIWVKIREIFLINFAWLLIIPLVLFLVAVFRKKAQKLALNTEWFFGIGGTGIVFLLFNFTYYTFTHYRYLQIYLPVFLILVVLLMEKATANVWLKRGISLLFVAAFLTESFVTVDPVTYLAFRNVDLGNGEIITTNEFITDPTDGQRFASAGDGADVEKGELLDSVVYNREYLGLERAFERAMKDIAYDETKGIILPAIYDQDMTYTALAYFGARDPWKLYWDSESGNITLDDKKDQIYWVDISKEIPDYLSGFEEVWYVKLPYRGEGYEEKNLEQFEILEKRTYTSGKWKITLEKVQLKK